MYIFLFPTELEATPFRRLCPMAKVYISGVGMAATAAAIASISQRNELGDDVCVVLCGIAGSYVADVAVGDVVEVASECCAELPDRFRIVYRPKSLLTTLRGVSSNCVDGKCACLSDAQIENMEGATLFAMSEIMGFRAAEIRAISNRVGDPFEKWQIAMATERLAEELLRLYP